VGGGAGEHAGTGEGGLPSENAVSARGMDGAVGIRGFAVFVRKAEMLL